jgi:hypothetical protein
MAETGVIVRPSTVSVKTRQQEEEFIPTIKINRGVGLAIRVPIDAEANRNSCILTAELARDFIKDQMARWTEHDRVFTPQELKEIMTAVKLCNEMTVMAHENISVPMDINVGKKGDSATGLMLKGVEAMARGQAKGTAEAQNEALRKFAEAGKAMKQADAIDVKAEKSTQ